MNRTPRIAQALAPLALLGSIAVATPLAHAAPAHHAPTAKTPQLRALTGQRAALGMLQHAASPDLTITICIGSHCVRISF
jgi:hypothetical protein